MKIEPEDVAYVSEMIRTAAKFDKEYAIAYEKMHNIFMYAAPDRTVPVEPCTTADESIEKINKMGEEAKKSIHQELEEIGKNTIAQAEKDMSEIINTATEETATQEEEDTDFCEVPTTSEPDKTEPPIIFQHPDYPTMGAGTDGQVYALKDGKWKKADARSVYFPKTKLGTWGRVEREEILELLKNVNKPATESPIEKTAEEYDTLPKGYFIHPARSNIAANEDGTIIKYNIISKKWTVAETNEDGRGCRKVKGERIGTAKCVYECINRRTVTSHVRHLNGDSWDDSFDNLAIYGDKNWHKFQQRTYDEADIHDICDYICKHNGDVSNISHDSKGTYSIYSARKILHKTIHDNISDKYFGYTSGGTLKIYKEGEVK